MFCPWPCLLTELLQSVLSGTTCDGGNPCGDGVAFKVNGVGKETVAHS
jgi:hypothetical protein